jgi:hypothetical protein
MREVEPAQAPAEALPESGVIKDARRHRRRERTAAGLLLLALIGAALLLVGNGNGAAGHRARAERPRWLSGAPLSKAIHLRLLVAENGGRPSIVDVASGQVQPVTGLGLPRVQRLWSPMLWPLTPTSGGALGVVVRRSCNTCGATETHYLISPNGAVRKLNSFRLSRYQSATTPVLGSSTAIWVLTHPRGRPCTLRQEPGSQPAVPVPCGELVDSSLIGSDASAGLVISTSSRMVLIDPRTGKLLARSPRGGQLDVLGRDVILTSGPIDIQGQGSIKPPLTLTNLRTEASLRLRWPSILHFDYQTFPEPHSPSVAVEFGDPAYHMSARQAGDVWMLNTRTGAFTHVPGFPIFEYLKVSGMAWTNDHRLVIVALGGGRASIGIWRPGSRRLQVGTVPELHGYLQFVPFTR